MRGRLRSSKGRNATSTNRFQGIYKLWLDDRHSIGYDCLKTLPRFTFEGLSQKRKLKRTPIKVEPHDSIAL
jgi:hypothetical protein